MRNLIGQLKSRCLYYSLPRFYSVAAVNINTIEVFANARHTAMNASIIYQTGHYLLLLIAHNAAYYVVVAQKDASRQLRTTVVKSNKTTSESDYPYDPRVMPHEMLGKRSSSLPKKAEDLK